MHTIQRLAIAAVSIMFVAACGAKTPTPVPTESDRVGQAARAIVGERLISSEVGDGVVTISYAAPQEKSENDLVLAVMKEYYRIVPAVFNVSQAELLHVQVQAPFIDSYGKTSTDQAFQFVIARTTADKVAWETLPADGYAKMLIAEGNHQNSATTHPALQETWTSIEKLR